MNLNDQDFIPVHVHGKEWLQILPQDGLVIVQPIKRDINLGVHRGGWYPLTPEKAELLIKALKRAIKKAKQ